MSGTTHELGRKRRRSEQERQFGHPVPAGYQALDNRDLEVDIVLPLRGGVIIMSGPLKMLGLFRVVVRNKMHNGHKGRNK